MGWETLFLPLLLAPLLGPVVGQSPDVDDDGVELVHAGQQVPVLEEGDQQGISQVFLDLDLRSTRRSLIFTIFSSFLYRI